MTVTAVAHPTLTPTAPSPTPTPSIDRLASPDLHCELVRIRRSFLQGCRKTEEGNRLFGVPAQTNQDSFRYKRAAFYSSIKGKVHLIFAKAAALRIKLLSISTPTAVLPSWAARTSHSDTRLARSSLPISFSSPPSSPIPYLKCVGGHLIQSP